MKAIAAILTHLEKPLTIDEIDIPELKPGQVLVKIHYSGICHTQLLEVMGKRGADPFLPHLLGHEGSGEVIAIGPHVTKVAPKDRVVLSWIKGSGMNVASSQYNWKGNIVNAGAITTLSHMAIISENRLFKIADTFPMKEAALIGCAIPTGFGAIFNTARPSPGESLAVFGCGGIGLCSIIAASIMGCSPIIAIDVDETKLDVARELGASYTINAASENVTESLKSIGALDYAIEASGVPSVMNLALENVRHQGGTVVVIGNAHHGDMLSINPRELNMGKKLLGTWGGESIPDEHFPRYSRLIAHKAKHFAKLTEQVFPLEQINEALTLFHNKKVVRPIIEMV